MIATIPLVGKTWLSNLSQCCFRDTHATWNEANQFLDTFKKFTHLRHASVSHITNFEITRLASHFFKLQSLTLKDSHVTNRGLASLSILSHLQKLEITGFCRITDAGLKALTSLTSLRSMIISKGMGRKLSKITLLGVAKLQDLHLEDLELHEFADEHLSVILLTGFKTLQNLTFLRCAGLHNLEEVLSMPTLQTLTLHSCWHGTYGDPYNAKFFEELLKKPGFQILSQHNQELERTGYDHQELITFRFISKHASHVKSLFLIRECNGMFFKNLKT